ncbi:MAG: hypothetical protein COY68_02205 [Candidatus Levybacteria bacterium CG_4_10_14_0_8_um_filter_35_23]|nr:MAG: hypothetical protein COY68_02205 [Candidatus Levybacteria bacterium CG_4_10_14_0_8_um_filter_35_23]PJC54155.1 MAG: hypothetical protein CO028_03950 [Candidatus Levybacteria bacterium CG_4_9_14_0_2_um_filter_35_21]
MANTIKREEDGTIILTVTIPVVEVEKIKSVIIDEYVKNAELPGFRKGKAPKKAVEKNLDKEKIKEEVLKKLLPQHYIMAVTENKLNPIMNPKIHVHKLEDDKDWKFEATTCEAPEIDLNGYKENIKKITAKTKIVIPGKEPSQVNFDDVVKELLDSVKIKIPKVILEQEVDRLLAQTLEEIKKLGLSLEQYLSSTKKTAADLRTEYEQKADADVKLEFTLQKIAQTEKITVEEKEIDEAINQAKTAAEKQNLTSNRYLLAGILRQQKTLDFLRSL